MRFRSIAGFLAVVIIATLTGCGARPVSASRFLMDTVCTSTLYNGTQEDLEAAFDYCETLAARLSRTDADSEISKLNRDGHGTLSAEVAEALNYALDIAAKTDGRFDPTIEPASSLWDFKSSALPDPADIEAALSRIDYRQITRNGTEVDLGGARLDLGAVAKGYISGKVAELLLSRGVKSGILNFGGNVVVLGDKPGGEAYTIGIREPFDETGIAAQVAVRDCAVVTAGIYERYIEQDGHIYHHILDPKTGYGVENDLASATILCRDPAMADALSTACILLGREKALEFLKDFEDVQAILIARDGSLFTTPDLVSQAGVWQTIQP